MVRKCKRMPEFAAVEMAQAGVRTTAATSSGTGKKRKVDNQEVHISTEYNVKIRSSDRTRRLLGTTPENSISQSPEVNSGHHAVLEGTCSNRSSDHASASCCLSNGTSERIEFADVKEESVEVETSMDSNCRERSETTPWSKLQAESSEEPDSTATKSERNSNSRSTAAEKTPTEAELGEFFAEAEKNLQKQFADKYNYDFAKDQPLEGRYEWVRLKP